ncbi:hypothetical protein ACFRAQ_34810 [Nocardia sp. NPDC056611]|uniref:hypothetical protein n=1 Tax=Nocardia sp. NPDC056611 TaxID=3345877 RepID=UPI00366B958E
MSFEDEVRRLPKFTDDPVDRLVHTLASYTNRPGDEWLLIATRDVDGTTTGLTWQDLRRLKRLLTEPKAAPEPDEITSLAELDALGAESIVSGHRDDGEVMAYQRARDGRWAQPGASVWMPSDAVFHGVRFGHTKLYVRFRSQKAVTAGLTPDQHMQAIAAELGWDVDVQGSTGVHYRKGMRGISTWPTASGRLMKIQRWRLHAPDEDLTVTRNVLPTGLQWLAEEED